MKPTGTEMTGTPSPRSALLATHLQTMGVATNTNLTAPHPYQNELDAFTPSPGMLAAPAAPALYGSLDVTSVQWIETHQDLEAVVEALSQVQLTLTLIGARCRRWGNGIYFRNSVHIW